MYGRKLARTNGSAAACGGTRAIDVTCSEAARAEVSSACLHVLCRGVGLAHPSHSTGSK